MSEEESSIDELMLHCTFNAAYTIMCLYHLKPTKKIKKHYKELPTDMRREFEKIFIEQGLFECVNSTITVTTKGTDFLMENILTQIDALSDLLSIMKEIEEENEDEYTEEEYIEEADNVSIKNIKRKEKRKQKRQQ